MEKIIYLEIDEEITSAIDKVKSAGEKEVALVLPKGATLLQSVINLKLLKKAADSEGKEISVVTSDRIGKTIALQVGIPVYNHIDKHGAPTGIEEPEETVVKEEAPKPREDDDGPLVSSHSKTKEVKKSSLKNAYYSEENADDSDDSASEEIKPFVRKEISETEEDGEEAANEAPERKIKVASHKLLWSVFLGIPLLIGGSAFILIPKADVTITVLSEKLPVTTNFTVDKEIPKVDAVGKILPGQFINEDKEEAKEFEATGKKNVGEKASGRVTLYNAYDSDPMSLVQGTSLQSTDGKVFKLTKEVAIPGATLDKGAMVAGIIQADVEAAEPGDSYNIGPTSFSIPKLGIPEVYAKSTVNMTGGFTKEIKVVSQEDVDKAKESYSKEVVEKYQNSLAESNKGFTIVKDAVKIDVLEASAEPAVGQETEKFKLKLKINEKAVLFEESDLKKLLTKILENEVPKEKEVYTSEIDQSKFALVSKFDKDFNEAEFKFAANVDLIPKLDTAKIQKSLAFKNVEAVKKELGSYDSVQDVAFKFFPFKMSKLPLMPKNIAVKLEVKK